MFILREEAKNFKFKDVLRIQLLQLDCLVLCSNERFDQRHGGERNTNRIPNNFLLECKQNKRVECKASSLNLQ